MGLLIEEILPLARQWKMDILSTGFLTVEVSAQNYAIPLGRVIGIVQSGPLTPLPFSPPQFEGLVLAMGQVVPQISLAILLGMPSKEGGVVVLLSDLGGSIGLRVDAVHAMLHVEGSQVAVATPAMRAERPLILGRFGDAPASYDILQLDHLFYDDRSSFIALVDGSRHTHKFTNERHKFFPLARIGHLVRHREIHLVFSGQDH